MRKIDLNNFRVAASETVRVNNRRIMLMQVRDASAGDRLTDEKPNGIPAR